LKIAYRVKEKLVFATKVSPDTGTRVPEFREGVGGLVDNTGGV
jgi:hypothetical protein